MDKIKYILLAVMVVTLSGCNDFLDLSPISQANENSFYKSEKDFSTAMNSVYNTLYTIYGPQSLPSYFGECASDNAWCNETAGDYTAKYALTKHQNLTSANAIVLEFWNTYYESIFKINNVIAKLGGADFITKNQCEGECRFLRALYYFDMVRAWGDVPLILTPVTVSESYGVARSAQADVYRAIVEDLKFASSNLPGKEAKRFDGAPSSDAANVLLGKVYLTMGDKSAAAEVLKREYGKFQLEGSYTDLWNLKNKNGKESIFEVQYKGGSQTSPYSRYWALFTPLDNRSVTAWGMGVNQVTEDLFNAYEVGDVRRDASVQDGYVNAAGEKIPDRFFIKWKDKDANLDGLTEMADNNFMILRYADVLLMLTEATGDAKYMNEVRKRVGLPGFGEAGYPSKYASLDAALQHEEQVEFAGEFHRMFDLIRHGSAVNVINNCTKEHGTVTEGTLLLPVPQYVIDQNPSVITQNEAYK